METWIIWAIISVFTGGLFHFLGKVTAERKYDSNSVNYLSYIFGAIVMFFVLVFQGNFSFGENIELLLLVAFGNVVFYSISFLTRVHAMRHIDTVIFYPLYKTFGPILVTLISVFLFHESLTGKELLGIIIGICVPLMLITKKENTIQKGLYIGVMMVIATSILTTISSVMPKFAHVWSLDITMFMFLTFFLGIPFSFLLAKFRRTKKTLETNTKGIYLFSALMGITNVVAFYTFIMAIEGNLAIAFTINSFAILIPIILSIIFYGEHFNLKKGIVILLSIISIILFI